MFRRPRVRHEPIPGCEDKQKILLPLRLTERDDKDKDRGKEEHDCLSYRDRPGFQSSFDVTQGRSERPQDVWLSSGG